MIVFTDFEQIDKLEGSVVALGNFDGVHKGHQELIRRTVNNAIGSNIKSTVFTFSNHPKNLLAGKQVVKNILTNEDKIKILGDLGVDYVVSVPFTEAIRDMEPEDFIMNILVNKLHLKQAYCGFNYRFGKGGSGSPETLMKVGLREGFGIHVLEPYLVCGQVVSSTSIRNYIESGDVGQCLSLMGHYYSTRGIVIKGNRFGRTLGFPTLNIEIDEDMVNPANGVYITYCNYKGIKYPSITNVGNRPTIGDSRLRNMETHIFNFNEEIYNKEIKIEFLQRLRPEIEFKTVEELAIRIKEDCLTAGAYHGIINR